MKRIEVSLVIGLFVSSAFFAVWQVTDIVRAREENDIEYAIYSGCIKWIINNFNETVSLVYETDPVNGDRLVGGNASGKVVMAELWLHNGNFLASLALERDRPDVARKIRLRIKDYYNISFGNQKFDWLLGNSVRFPPYGFSYYVVDSSLNVSNEEWDNEQDIWRHWPDFSDWAAIRVMVESIAGNSSGVDYWFQQMISSSYFNGFAVNDSVSTKNGEYETFKQVLPIIVADQLEKDLPFRSTLIERLRGVQLENGGMPYKFDLNGDPFTDSYNRRGNLEATALTAIALRPKEVPMGVFVYAWYGDGLGQRHWNDGPYGPVVDEPLDGYYSSLNYTQWLKTFQLISDAGFDFVCLSYWGNNSYEHNATKIAVQALNDSGCPLKFCILYEPFNWTGEPSNPYVGLLYDYRNYTITNNVIYNNFVTPYRSKYFEFQGKPLLLSFNPARPPKDDSRFTIRWLGHESWVDWIFWSYPLIIRNGCASVIPRLDNRFLPNGTLALDVDMSHGLYERQIDTIIREYRRSPDNIDVVLFYGWNEYHERTEIEPHIDYNNVPNTYTYNATKKYIEIMRREFNGIRNVGFDLGMNYLSKIQFVDSLGLCKESQANPNWVWLANDNIYAYYLFNRICSPLANSIRDRLDEYNCWSNGKAELILNDTVKTFRKFTYYNVTCREGYLIRVELLIGKPMQDFGNYSDLCFWWSYNELLQGNVSGAVQWWDRGFSFYNGTGFKDLGFYDWNGTHYVEKTHFDTFKLGLCLWSAYQINYTMYGGFHRDGLAKIEGDMWRMQSPTLGGFYTGYNKNFDPDGTTPNTETTCLCLIPYTVPPPKTPTSISCNLSKTSITKSESVIVSGAINASVSAPVTIQTRTDNGATWINLTTVTTASNGTYSYSWTLITAGTYEVKATWPGDDTHLGATSQEVTLTVTPDYTIYTIAIIAILAVAAGTVFLLRRSKAKLS